VNRRPVITLAFVILALASASNALACATCYGQSDSDLAQGMNMGIMVLLGFIGMVLAGVASFFVFIIRRSTAVAAETAQQTLPTTKI